MKYKTTKWTAKEVLSLLNAYEKDSVGIVPPHGHDSCTWPKLLLFELDTVF